MIIKAGEITPNNKKLISNKVNVDAFTSSPCLLHDFFKFIRVSLL